MPWLGIFLFKSSSRMKDPGVEKHGTGILTGQGYLAGSKSLRSGALERERDRKRTYRNPRGAGRHENQESRPKQATTERRWNRKSGGGVGARGKVTEAWRLQLYHIKEMVLGRYRETPDTFPPSTSAQRHWDKSLNYSSLHVCVHVRVNSKDKAVQDVH